MDSAHCGYQQQKTKEHFGATVWGKDSFGMHGLKALLISICSN